MSLALHILVLVVANYVGFKPLPRLPAKHSGVLFVRLATFNPLAEQELPHADAAPSGVEQAASDVFSSSPDTNALVPDGMDQPTQTPADPYYHRKALTIPARPLAGPELPPTIEELNGALKLTLLINESGVVDTVEAEKSAWPPKYVVRLKAEFKKMTFHPGMLDTNPVKSRFEVIVSAPAGPKIIQSKTISETSTEP